MILKSAKPRNLPQPSDQITVFAAAPIKFCLVRFPNLGFFDRIGGLDIVLDFIVPRPVVLQGARATKVILDHVVMRIEVNHAVL